MTRDQLNTLDYFLLTIYDLDMVSWTDQDLIWKISFNASGLRHE